MYQENNQEQGPPVPRCGT
uniref:Uncharacterized protein n=1 Tax=Anguilla anguilla TaxID=7936 RepID=A0A0E9W463_ANGAN